jgi:hypothetical protein
VIRDSLPTTSFDLCETAEPQLPVKNTTSFMSALGGPPDSRQATDYFAFMPLAVKRCRLTLRSDARWPSARRPVSSECVAVGGFRTQMPSKGAKRTATTQDPRRRRRSSPLPRPRFRCSPARQSRLRGSSRSRAAGEYTLSMWRRAPCRRHTPAAYHGLDRDHSAVEQQAEGDSEGPSDVR